MLFLQPKSAEVSLDTREERQSLNLWCQSYRKKTNKSARFTCTPEYLWKMSIKLTTTTHSWLLQELLKWQFKSPAIFKTCLVFFFSLCVFSLLVDQLLFNFSALKLLSCAVCQREITDSNWAINRSLVDLVKAHKRKWCPGWPSMSKRKQL